MVSVHVFRIKPSTAAGKAFMVITLTEFQYFFIKIFSCSQTADCGRLIMTKDALRDRETTELKRYKNAFQKITLPSISPPQSIQRAFLGVPFVFNRLIEHTNVERTDADTRAHDVCMQIHANSALQIKKKRVQYYKSKKSVRIK